MVQNSNKRIANFAAKVQGDIRKQRYDAQKDTMVRLETKASMDMEKIEIQIKDMAQGYPALHLPYYIIFAKEIYKKKNRFTGQTLIDEMMILEDKWERRGLAYNLLETIKKFYVDTYPHSGGIFFIMDESLMDGDKVFA